MPGTAIKIVWNGGALEVTVHFYDISSISMRLNVPYLREMRVLYEVLVHIPLD